jgi:hypothetical protein
MKDRVIEDLHGHTFIAGDYKLSITLPPHSGARLNYNMDRLRKEEFILVKFSDKDYGYIFYANYVYIYGELSLVNYNPKNDIRHVKEAFGT